MFMCICINNVMDLSENNILVIYLPIIWPREGGGQKPCCNLIQVYSIQEKSLANMV